MTGNPEPRRGRSESPRKKDSERRTMFKTLKKGVFHMLGDKRKSMSAYSNDLRRRSYHISRGDTESCYQSSRSRETEFAFEKRHNKRASSRRMDPLSGNPFTPRIRYFDFPETRMPSHIKTYNRSEDPEYHLKFFQAAAKTERWAMPTWCHMFNSTLTRNARVWSDDLPQECIDSYDDLKKAFLDNYLQLKKCIKDLVEIHNIKQRDGESTEEFVRRYKLECKDVKEASKCIKISGFMHGITNPELIKRLHDKIPKSVDEKMRVTTTFLREAKVQEGRLSEPIEVGAKSGQFTLLTKTPKEILTLDKGKLKPPPPMITPVETRNARKFCDFHGEVGHTTDECMHLKRKTEKMLKARKLSHLMKELKQNNGKDQIKAAKKGEISRKDKPLAILMVQPWQRIAKQRITQSFSPKSVISFPPLGEEDGTEGPMIIEAEIGGPFVHRMYVDGGSSLEIFYERYFNGFRPGIRSQMVPAATPLVGFNGEIIWPLGQLSLLVKIGDEEHSTSAWMNFIVVRTVTLRSSKVIPLECTMVSGTGCNLDIFAWKPADMTGVLRHIANHRLNIHEGCLPVRQKKRGQAPERNKAIYEEVEKLVDAGIMKKVNYHSWLSNPVMVKKHDGSWRMCIDFKDLNKTCPKDGYPLLKIEWKVESLCGYPFKCFMDAYKGYHQIKMAKEDEEKTAFITSQGIFYYSKMPFRLKNTGATYQRLVDKAFHKQIGQNLEVYVDDLVIKSHMEQEVIRDIEETFKTLRRINMKFNPKKCTFGMRKSMFLGYKVNYDGLKVCPDRVEAVLSLPSPNCLKDVQKLNGKLASLNSDFIWTAEAETVFKQMNKLIAKLPTLPAPKEKEELIIYLAAAKEEISAVLMTERDGKQMHIYFISRVLQGPKFNYIPMEKLKLALVSASKRLKRYFQAHTIIVITDQPIKQMLSNPEVTGRLLKYRFEIEEHDIDYRPRTSVKGQILADFVVEHPEDNSLDTPMKHEEELLEPWILFTDGSSCIDGSEASLIITNLEGIDFTYALRFRFDATNNEAEYEALIAGLWIAE
nr:reverse transcriptase domain-containing protein [Tanacetum cinerariifolium]